MTDPDWARLFRDHPEPLVAELKRAYEQDSVAMTARDLASLVSGFDESEAKALLEDAGDWLSREEQPGEVDSDFPDEIPPTTTLFVWRGPPRRRTEWLLLVHGMNTNGRWQEHLAFGLGLWQGQSVPTFVYKYGWIVAGVMLPWRRAQLKRSLHSRIRELSTDAPAFEVGAAPDVVAHSFGTWLVGHLLLDELKRPTGLRLGRVILTGSILRPDFPWVALQTAGLVEDVLNHYGTRDVIVPLAHWTIFDSGPSGRRGFDIEPSGEGKFRVLNVKTDFAHSGALSDKERYDNFKETWKPFLTNPAGRASRDVLSVDPKQGWRPAWWLLRGTLLPVVVVPLFIALVLWLLLMLGSALSSLDERYGGALLTSVGYLTVAVAALLMTLVAYLGRSRARSRR